MSGNTSVQQVVREYLEAGKFVGMICAGTGMVHEPNLATDS